MNLEAAERVRLLKLLKAENATEHSYRVIAGLIGRHNVEVNRAQESDRIFDFLKAEKEGQTYALRIAERPGVVALINAALEPRASLTEGEKVLDALETLSHVDLDLVEQASPLLIAMLPEDFTLREITGRSLPAILASARIASGEILPDLNLVEETEAQRGQRLSLRVRAS